MGKVYVTDFALRCALPIRTFPAEHATVTDPHSHQQSPAWTRLHSGQMLVGRGPGTNVGSSLMVVSELVVMTGKVRVLRVRFRLGLGGV